MYYKYFLYICIIIIIFVYMDTIHKIGHSVIAGGTVVAVATPDHTAQWLALAIQLVSLVALIFGKKSKN